MALQNRLTRLLSRGIEARQVRSLVDPPIVLATALGRRAENQDRVAVIRMRSALRPNRSLMAIAVSDGMGGMRDGGACASLTLAAFFEELLRLRTFSLPDRVRRSTLLANERVHALPEARAEQPCRRLSLSPRWRLPWLTWEIAAFIVMLQRLTEAGH